MKQSMLGFSVLITFCLWSLPIGCILDSEQEKRYSQPAAADSILHLSTTGLTASFVVVCIVPEAHCWAFDKTEFTAEENAYQVKQIAFRVTDKPCLQIIGSIETPFSVTVPEPGSYTFKFWTYNDSSIDTTLVFY